VLVIWYIILVDLSSYRNSKTKSISKLKTFAFGCRARKRQIFLEKIIKPLRIDEM